MRMIVGLLLIAAGTAQAATCRVVQATPMRATEANKTWELESQLISTRITVSCVGTQANFQTGYQLLVAAPDFDRLQEAKSNTGHKMEYVLMRNSAVTGAPVHLPNTQVFAENRVTLVAGMQRSYQHVLHARVPRDQNLAEGDYHHQIAIRLQMN